MDVAHICGTEHLRFMTINAASTSKLETCVWLSVMGPFFKHFAHFAFIPWTPQIVVLLLILRIPIFSLRQSYLSSARPH